MHSIEKPNLFAILVLGAAVALAAPLACAETTQSETASPPSSNDPLEPFNRKVFWFNDKLDTYVLKPVATGYDRVVPHVVQRSVRNFFDNLRFPVFALNDLLQAKPKAAARDVGRFAVNTTVGVAGFFDPASRFGLERHWEDFGQTLGVWGLGPGPYLVLPILGPSSPRDTTGLVVDYFFSVVPLFVPAEYLWSARVVDTVNSRSLALGTVEEARAAALDFYSSVRSAYFEHRRAQVNDGAEGAPSEDLYQLEPDQEVVPQ
jgi:phospholipid-binding lipoprotein MlaA